MYVFFFFRPICAFVLKVIFSLHVLRQIFFILVTKQTYVESLFRESDLRLQTMGNIGEMGGRIRGTLQC